MDAPVIVVWAKAHGVFPVEERFPLPDNWDYLLPDQKKDYLRQKLSDFLDREIEAGAWLLGSRESVSVSWRNHGRND